MSPQLSSEIDKVQVYSNFMFDNNNTNYWGVTVNLREDTNPRPPLLGLPIGDNKIIRRFRGKRYNFNTIYTYTTINIIYSILFFILHN